MLPMMNVTPMRNAYALDRRARTALERAVLAARAAARAERRAARRRAALRMLLRPFGRRPADPAAARPAGAATT